MNKYKTIVIELLSNIEKENYRGYDPYDFYLSPIAKYLPKSILFLHFFKFLPINFRPLLGIKKGMVTKVYALMIDSYLNLYEIEQDRAYLNKAEDIYNKMLNEAVVNTKDELGWGRNYPFMTGGEIHDNTKPLVYLDARLGQAMVHLYDAQPNDEILSNLSRVVINLIKVGRIHQYEGWKFLGYSSDTNTRLTFNASMVAVETIMKFMNRAKIHEFYVDGYELKSLCYDIIRTIIHFQNTDGSWIYGYSAKGKAFEQKDFHQGFVIDSLYEVISLIEDDVLKKEAKKAYDKGYQYLKNVQINEKGFFYWRYPKKYPIDIHNQAQGILSMVRNKSDLDTTKLQVMLTYTIKTFWKSKKNCFSYQKWPMLVNRISYVRWCNAWMLYVLTVYLKNIDHI